MIVSRLKIGSLTIKNKTKKKKKKKKNQNKTHTHTNKQTKTKTKNNLTKQKPSFLHTFTKSVKQIFQDVLGQFCDSTAQVTRPKQGQGKTRAKASERNSHRRSPFTLDHHLPTVGAKS